MKRKSPRRSSPEVRAGRRQANGGLSGSALTRAEAAGRLGIGETTVRHWERTGKLKAIVRDGVHLFARAQVERLRSARDVQVGDTAPEASDAGPLAARVFAALDRGKSAVTI